MVPKENFFKPTEVKNEHKGESDFFFSSENGKKDNVKFCGSYFRARSFFEFP